MGTAPVIYHLQRAVQDLKNNGFLNAVAIVTIALAIVIVGAFALVFFNAERLIGDWQKGLRIFVFLKPDTDETQRRTIHEALKRMDVAELTFVSRQQALERLRRQLQRQSSLLDNLKENPLPDAFELRLAPTMADPRTIAGLAGRIETLAGVEEAAYGQPWIERFIHLYRLFTLAGWSIGALFTVAAVFIVANTIRLVLYNRREEIDIMRLVGATDGFIKAPFYIEALIQGAVGGLLGLAGLAAIYGSTAAQITQGLGPGLFRVAFLPIPVVVAIWLGSMVVGLTGCMVSLKQFMHR